MKIHLAAAALIAVAPPTFAIQSAAAQQAARPMTAGATLAEKHVRTLLKSATPGAKMDYSILTAEVGKSVRDHPEGGDMIIKLGTPQTVTYLGDPPAAICSASPLPPPRSTFSWLSTRRVRSARCTIIQLSRYLPSPMGLATCRTCGYLPKP